MYYACITLYCTLPKFWKYMVHNLQIYSQDVLNKSKVFAKQKISIIFKLYKYVSSFYIALRLVYLTTPISTVYKASNGDLLLK